MAFETGKKYRVIQDFQCYSEPDIVSYNRWLKAGDIIIFSGTAVRGNYHMKHGDRELWGYPGKNIELVDNDK